MKHFSKFLLLSLLITSIMSSTVLAAETAYDPASGITYEVATGIGYTTSETVLYSKNASSNIFDVALNAEGVVDNVALNIVGDGGGMWIVNINNSLYFVPKSQLIIASNNANTSATTSSTTTTTTNTVSGYYPNNIFLADLYNSEYHTYQIAPSDSIPTEDSAVVYSPSTGRYYSISWPTMSRGNMQVLNINGIYAIYNMKYPNNAEAYYNGQYYSILHIENINQIPSCHLVSEWNGIGWCYALYNDNNESIGYLEDNSCSFVNYASNLMNAHYYN